MNDKNISEKIPPRPSSLIVLDPYLGLLWKGSFGKIELDEEAARFLLVMSKHGDVWQDIEPSKFVSHIHAMVAVEAQVYLPLQSMRLGTRRVRAC